jgi:hypothetical protein
MAESFFIRAQATSNGTNFAQTTISLGSYVDVLGNAILKIHGTYPAWRNAGNDFPYDAGLNDADMAAGWQLTTQSQVDLVPLTDKSVICSGGIQQCFDSKPKMIMTSIHEDPSVEKFTNGYLVATEDIYLGVDKNTGTGDEFDLDMVIECSVVRMSSSKAMALALSQQ